MLIKPNYVLARTFETGTGDVTLNGNTTINGSKTFETGTGDVALNGDVNIAANKQLCWHRFETGTGNITLNGDVTIDTGKSFSSDNVNIDGGSLMAPNWFIFCFIWSITTITASIVLMNWANNYITE